MLKKKKLIWPALMFRKRAKEVAKNFEFPRIRRTEYNEVCCNCGHRNGEHYYGDSCEISTTPDSSYNGTYFEGSDKHSDDRGVKHWDVIKDTSNDPNAAFRMKR